MEPLKINPGIKYNSLTIIKEVDPKTIDGKRPKRQFMCECVCGRRIVVRLDALRNNKKSSCGCQLPVKLVLVGTPVEKHGLSRELLYKIWKKIKGRCYCVTDKMYYNYGGRGISMSDDWYINPVSFYNWSVKNGYEEGLELDRINNEKGYFPDNCRWTTSEVNNNNKRNNIKYLYKGIWLTLPQISRKHGIVGFSTLYRRINENKLSLEEALTIPLWSRCKKGRNIRFILSDQQAIEIYKSKKLRKELCKTYRVHISTIDGIRSGTRYPHIKQQCSL
jgi:hypothetical protein